MESTSFNLNNWLKTALLNFLVVALAGIILRYKINFPLPLINQKYLLHGHSHFAFVGWVTLALMALMVNYLLKNGLKTNYRKYHWILLANTITAYGMLLTFVVQGYAFFSITFSTLSIFVSYAFIYFFWQDLRKIKEEFAVKPWFKTALILWALSSLGAFTLAYLMASQIKVQDYYFAAIYFFLHFQYNGWFIFAGFGLLFSFFNRGQHAALLKLNRALFLILAATVVPGYFLSLLWLKLPSFVYWTATFSGILQLLALFYFFKFFKLIKAQAITYFTKTTRFLWTLAALSFVIKISLQFLSVFPNLSDFAFGFRPIVIAYLHLCFLGIISFFLIGHFNEVLAPHRKMSKSGIMTFVSGVIIQEIALMIQGLEMIGINLPIPTGIILFVSSLIMGTGLFLMVRKIWDIKKSTANTIHNGLTKINT
ncbi:hypothetical protein SAMN05421820_10475 [Pedobacter steynii]|uniref:Uncharacterized protein n=1 Tax=Pedobacter steynii TaxID=430522 RepID=A0A1G9U6Z2_9SPHI|nr:hypothetical protein [Pedobacter steynii]NQX40671.1 hypothetical protein [Pedobacter steynii]SDM55444.1 hypothetical protein SAMN05421820_10475 [Pedobacter steynii]